MEKNMVDTYTEEEMREKNIYIVNSNEKYHFVKSLAPKLRTCKATRALSEYDVILNCNTTILNSATLLTNDVQYFSEERLAEIEKTILFAKDYLMRYGQAFIDWNQKNPYILDKSSDLLLAKQKHESTCPFYKKMREELEEVQKYFRNLISYFENIEGDKLF